MEMYLLFAFWLNLAAAVVLGVGAMLNKYPRTVEFTRAFDALRALIFLLFALWAHQLLVGGDLPWSSRADQHRLSDSLTR